MPCLHAWQRTPPPQQHKQTILAHASLTAPRPACCSPALLLPGQPVCKHTCPTHHAAPSCNPAATRTPQACGVTGQTSTTLNHPPPYTTSISPPPTHTHIHTAQHHHPAPSTCHPLHPPPPPPPQDPIINQTNPLSPYPTTNPLDRPATSSSQLPPSPQHPPTPTCFCSAAAAAAAPDAAAWLQTAATARRAR